MEYVSCNFCGLDDSELVNEGPDLGLARPGNFRLVRCLNCRLIYQNPRPTLEEISSYYPVNYDRYITEVDSAGFAQRYSHQHEIGRQCQRVQRYHPRPGRLLDVGCATGLFLRGIRDRGWKVSGVEISNYAAAFARENYGLDAKTGTLEAAAFPPASFDVVTLWDVLEHVIDPQATLAEVARVLRPGGVFIASTPNPTSVEARIFGANWIGWERPRHLYLFTPDLLRQYLERAGFKVLGFESFSGRLRVTLLSLEYSLRARGLPEERWRPLIRAAYNWPMRIASWPLYRLGEAFNTTTSITVYARLNKGAILDFIE